MKPSVLRSLFLCSYMFVATLSVAFAQLPGSDLPRGNARMSGVIVDSLTKKPVEYATVALIDLQTTKPIDGAIADGKGEFSLTKLPEGEFRLRVSFIGYQNKIIRGIKINRRDDVNLGTIILSPDERTLKEVEVVGQKAMIEEKVDRIVYNADRDIMSKGGRCY